MVVDIWVLLELCAPELRSDPQFAAVLLQPDCTVVRAAAMACSTSFLHSIGAGRELDQL
jgi:hypothetical protein